MGCVIADNKPLKMLRKDLGLPESCHSSRGRCVRDLSVSDHYSTRSRDYTMASAGAAIGYCQGLFNRHGSADAHTRHVADQLSSIDAPWPRSHELLLGYSDTADIGEYLTMAMDPLKESGRVPILITQLDPRTDYDAIKSIVGTKPPVKDGETVLVRLSLASEDSIKPTANLMKDILDNSYRERKMPRWWPLLQTDYGPSEWAALIDALGQAWKYTNIAVTPFTAPSSYDVVRDQVTVAQFLVGKADGVHSDGTVEVPYDSCIREAEENKYNIFRYAEHVNQEGLLPTSIVCGPSRPEWTLEDNLGRLRKFVPLFTGATKILWDHLDEETRKSVLNLQA